MARRSTMRSLMLVNTLRTFRADLMEHNAVAFIGGGLEQSRSRGTRSAQWCRSAWRPGACRRSPNPLDPRDIGDVPCLN
jgi:hypothetical protein